MDALEEANGLIVALTDTLLEKREKIAALEARVGPLEVACRAASSFCEAVDDYNAIQGNATPGDVLELKGLCDRALTGGLGTAKKMAALFLAYRAIVNADGLDLVDDEAYMDAIAIATKKARAAISMQD